MRHFGFIPVEIYFEPQPCVLLTVFVRSIYFLTIIRATQRMLNSMGTQKPLFLGVTRVSMEVILTIVSKLVYNLIRGRIQPTYRGYNPVTKFQQDIEYSYFTHIFRA